MHGMEKAEDTGIQGLRHPSHVGAKTTRITMLEFPPGSPPGRVADIRNTILPWFVDLKDDGEILDNEEPDKWSDPVVAHVSHTAVAVPYSTNLPDWMTIFIIPC